MTALALVADLMFGSKLAATARAHGIDYRGARSLEGLRTSTAVPRLVLVDLEAELPDGDPLDAVTEALEREPRPRVIAFAGHLQVDRLEQARRAGADLVLSRGGLAGRLEAIFAELATPT